MWPYLPWYPKLENPGCATVKCYHFSLNENVFMLACSQIVPCTMCSRCTMKNSRIGQT
ncbi:hypothetical protein HOLleu_36560 [Holothuria leucospilota]|uniref:Uncharacterized protein n=1 Tax=Holothuria leucospilota TaxID=206669 RepID=A0A9Q0YMC3_HOLLE|nr:hypothetical protein HOLleu_36560 [Holothuria leucospilota]